MAEARQPKWTGADGEMAIIVSRGEPVRSNLEMQRIVYAQARDYLRKYVDHTISDLVLALAVQLIAEDYIEPPGHMRVMLTREHLIAFVQVAKTKLGELKEDSDGQP